MGAALALLAVACVPAELRPAPSEARARPGAPEQQPRVVIVGAGLTGLVAAYELKKLGIDALVLEQSERIGGRIQTVRWKSGAIAEAHMEEYWEGSPALPLLEELGLVERERDGEAAHSSVRIDGTLYPYRGEGARDDYLAGLFDAEERSAFLRFNARAVAVHEQLDATFFAGKPLTDELRGLMRVSLEDWVAAQRLPRKVSEWIRVTVEPEMAVEWDRVSALDGVDELRLFLDRAGRFGERNYHVPGGNRRFVEALVERVGRERIQTSTRVTAIEQDRDGATVRVLRDSTEFDEVRAQVVLVTVPLFAVGRIQFRPALPETMRQAISTTRFGAYVKVLVGVRPEGYALTLKDGVETLTLLSDSEAGSVYHATDGDPLAPGEDHLLTLLLHGDNARRYAGRTADEVRDGTFRALDELFPGIAKHLTFAEVFAYPTAVAYWPLAEGRSRFDDAAQSLRDPFGRVLLGGDTTENSHSEGAVRAAKRLARQVAEERYYALEDAAPPGLRVPAQH